MTGCSAEPPCSSRAGMRSRAGGPGSGSRDSTAPDIIIILWQVPQTLINIYAILFHTIVSFKVILIKYISTCWLT